MDEVINIGIAEDHEITREGLAEVIVKHSGMHVLFRVKNGKDLLKQLELYKPDVILLDVKMPVMSGGVALERIKLKYKDLRVIMLTNFATDEHIIKYIALGACAFIDKNISLKRLFEAIKTVHDTGQFFDERTTGLLAANVRNFSKALQIKEYPDGLSDREVSVIKLLCKKKSLVDIATTLGTLVSTIQFYEKSIYEKLKLDSHESIIKYALKNRIIKNSGAV